MVQERGVCLHLQTLGDLSLIVGCSLARLIDSSAAGHSKDSFRVEQHTHSFVNHCTRWTAMCSVCSILSPKGAKLNCGIFPENWGLVLGASRVCSRLCLSANCGA